MRAPLHELNDVTAACKLGFFPYIAFPAPHFVVPEPKAAEPELLTAPAEPEAAEIVLAEAAPVLEAIAAVVSAEVVAESRPDARVNEGAAAPPALRIPASVAPAIPSPTMPAPAMPIAALAPPAWEARPANTMAPAGTLVNAALLRDIFQPAEPAPSPAPAPRAMSAPVAVGAAHRRTNHAGEFAMLAEMSGLSIPVPPAPSAGLSVARTGLAPAAPPNPPERRPARSVASQVLAIARVAGAKDV